MREVIACTCRSGPLFKRLHTTNDASCSAFSLALSIFTHTVLSRTSRILIAHKPGTTIVRCEFQPIASSAVSRRGEPTWGGACHKPDDTDTLRSSCSVYLSRFRSLFTFTLEVFSHHLPSLIPYVKYPIMAQMCPVVGTTTTVLPPGHPPYDTSDPEARCPVTNATVRCHISGVL